MTLGNSILACENTLAELFDRKHCILTGRGATALWMCYSLATVRRPKIILPALVCLSPLFTVGYAGGEAVFADVLEQNATIDAEEVDRLLSQDSEIGAVLAVHLYGHKAEIGDLKKICTRRNVLLIEDAAQSFGGRDEKGNLLGSYGDVSVLSFGHSKILDLGFGGAILTDCDDKASYFRSKNKLLNEPEIDFSQLSEIYSKLYYTIFDGSRLNSRFFELYDHFPELFYALYFRKITDAQALIISNKLKNFQKELNHRQKLAFLYDQHLESLPNVRFFKRGTKEVPWRYSFCVPEKLREKLLNEIRNHGFDASSWYPSITNWTKHGRKLGRSRFPNAFRIQDEVINLWVTSDYSEENVYSISELIARVLNNS